MSNQKPRTEQEHLSILKSRGMLFEDEKKALAFLSRVSYFRLKYYWMDMLDKETEHDFIANTHFSTVVERYEFDKALRQIIFGAVGILEIGLRTRIINVISEQYGSGLWYLDKALFENEKYHEDFVLELKYEFGRSTDPFARDYINSHAGWDKNTLIGDNPDAWMIFETASFGTLSKMYKNLKPQLPARSAIANSFGLYSAKDLSSWLEAISMLRNIVAHHSRLWYRIFPKKPTNLKGHRDKWLASDMTEGQKQRVFGPISALLYLSNAIFPENNIKRDILALFDAHPNIPVYQLGFTKGWRENPIWK
ncbi:Abi family protein [Bacteroides fragilis]|uniref:Abi family protein n=1 Tax=Bacteroides fragilis TaxID=817 RepID=UPI0022AAA0EA|nr:Abi family protein [Bacteroides fragilis]MCZ2695838.1 Abi family protein [Bacteroides fragilis]